MRALTLIELIISIVVFSIIMVPILLVFATVSEDTVNGIYLNRAHTLACSYQELVLAKSFDDNKYPPFSDNLGPEESDISDYDDVDDFNNYELTDPDYPELSGRIEVYYIVENPDGSIDWNNPSSSATNYKRIDIKVSHARLGQVIVCSGVTYAGHTTK